MDLLSKLGEVSNASRLSTVEAALAGSPGAQANFKASWQGFDDAGNAQVKVDGKIYTAGTLGVGSLPPAASVLLRVGKGIKSVNW